jgi:hypothetical protein
MMFSIAALAGAAAGVCSIIYFLGLVCGVNPFVLPIVSALICAALVKWLRPTVNDLPGTPPARWLPIAFLVVLVAAAATFIFTARKEPHGYWDAWSIWNLHARFLERGGAHWSDLFTTNLGWTHPDYPLLLPSIVAQAWAVLRSESAFIPAAIAFLFTFGTVAMLMGAVQRLRGWDQALIAGAFLLGTATFLLHGASQYADVPLAFYMVATLALLCFEDVKCTVLAGFAAWTKNEGLLFIVVVVLALSITRLRHRTAAKLLGELKWFAAGLAPVLAVVALFKWRYAPPGDLLSHRFGEVLAHLVDFGRWVTLLKAFVQHAFLFGWLPIPDAPDPLLTADQYLTWLLIVLLRVLPGIITLVIFAFLVRFKVDPERRTAVATIVTAVLLMLVGDFAVYLLLSNDMNWQIDTSLDRILMQLWPAALLGFFAAASRVELASAPRPHKETKKDAKKAAATRRR